MLKLRAWNSNIRRWNRRNLWSRPECWGLRTWL